MSADAEVLIAVIEGAIIQRPGEGAYGDLFLTDAGLWFIPYCDADPFLASDGEKMAAAAGRVLGGTLVGIAAGSAVRAAEDRTQAKATAEVSLARLDDYGFDLSERLSRSWKAATWAMQLNLDQLDNALAKVRSGKLTCVTTDWVTYKWIFQPEDADENAINLWASRVKERPRQPVDAAKFPLPDPRRYGLGTKRWTHSPVELLDLLRRGQPIGSDELAQVCDDDNYVAVVYARLLSLSRKDVVAVCQYMARGQGTMHELAVLLGGKAPKALQPGDLIGMGLLLALAALCLGLVVLCLGQAVFMALAGFGAVSCGVGAMYLAITARRRPGAVIRHTLARQ